ncbi:fumarylacetoacetate hydrolase family protein [uncultured Desulfosarcina sp.]|uniref:2-keto-4-pentenoate hydratase n=1 Tax=uncultured Desulfosarcina sp. TaxID=218289 RepID=UPI0029C74701|nr:fumarylacetoacetate hydrolase family protein [uncultured Desulfosarcina sp.]
MSHPMDLQAIAEEIKAAQDHCRTIVPLTSRFRDFSTAEAYAVAQMIHEKRLTEGAIPVGRKIGFTNPEMWSIYGVREPIWGYLYDTTVVKLTDSRFRCRIGQFAEPKIEPEIVVHFGLSPPERADIADVLASIDWIAHGIEIVQSHFPGWKFQAADTIADWGLHATLIVGKPMDINLLGVAVAGDLENFTVTLSCDGEVREKGKGSNALGNPLKAIVHLIDVIAKQPYASRLQYGELVTTGTLTAALPILPGQTWATNLDGIPMPGISVLFEK